MLASTFNAITYANKLKGAGMAATIADVQAEEMGNLINSELVTKSFLSKELRELELKILVKVGGMMFVQTSLILSVVGFMVKHT